MIKRWHDNPVLERDTLVRYDALFNPGVVEVGDKVIMVVRAARDSRKLIMQKEGGNYVYTNMVCDHIIFESLDGGDTFVPTLTKMAGTSSTWIDGYSGEVSVPTYYGPFGAEDMMLSKVGDQYVGTVHVMTHAPYTGDRYAGGRIGLVVTKDFRHFKRFLVGPQRPETDRDAFIIDMGDKIALTHRLRPDIEGARRISGPNIQAAFFKNLDELITASPEYWKEHNDKIDEHVIVDQQHDWEAIQLGGGPVIEHEKGYLFFYHGVSGPRIYRTGVALLDKNSLKELSRLKTPLIDPTEWYEVGDFGGDTRKITWPGGAIYSPDKKTIQLYYGAADTHVARADIDVDQLIQRLISN
jgi:predicted GH43/DUF377 family glycosyl hydrolase